MHPVLFELSLGGWGRFTVGTYGLFYAVGFLLALRLAVFYARRDGIEAGRIIDLGIVALLAGFIGAKLLLYAIDLRYYLSHPIEMLHSLRSAGVFYGGLGLAVAASLFYVRRHRLPLGKVADLAAPALSLGQGIGRLGCFFAGCCYGVHPWAVTFTDVRAAERPGATDGPTSDPTHHAAADFVILAITARQMRRRAFVASLLDLSPFYSVFRAVVETGGATRCGACSRRLPSTSQLISIPVAVCRSSCSSFCRGGRRGRGKKPPADDATRARDGARRVGDGSRRRRGDRLIGALTAPPT
jgi:phosphatidylglycerol:prolipoprotein diacylglycerol transferase